MLEYVALDTMYFIVIEPILMFFYESHQKSDGILRGSLVKYVNVLHPRTGHTTEPVKIPYGLPLTTNCIHNIRDINAIGTVL
jgi:hypothetical protein